MAQRVQVILEDDIDGGSAAETVSFSIDGSSYEIDLSKKNAAKLRDKVEPLLRDGDKRRAMSDAARAIGKPDAAERVADVIAELSAERR